MPCITTTPSHQTEPLLFLVQLELFATFFLLGEAEVAEVENVKTAKEGVAVEVELEDLFLFKVFY
jgi:hypothetical protein